MYLGGTSSILAQNTGVQKPKKQSTMFFFEVKNMLKQFVKKTLKNPNHEKQLEKQFAKLFGFLRRFFARKKAKKNLTDLGSQPFTLFLKSVKQKLGVQKALGIRSRRSA